MRSAIFDLDGTLADTSGDLIAAANDALEGGFLDPVADMAVAFGGGRAMLTLGYQRQGLDPQRAREKAETVYEPFLELYRRNLDVRTTVYPGVEAALDVLEAEGWKIAICTNKPVDLAEELMRRLGLRHRFAALLGAGSLPVKKPDPRHLLETISAIGGRADRAVLMGDTVTDRDAARNAGVRCALVTFGPHGRGVAELEPDALFDHYDDLPALLERMVPRPA